MAYRRLAWRRHRIEPTSAPKRQSRFLASPPQRNVPVVRLVHIHVSPDQIIIVSDQ